MIRIALAIVLALFVQPPARADIPDGPLPPLFVAIHVQGSATTKGFDGTRPMEVREYRPQSQVEADKVAGLIPGLNAEFTWDFSHGFGQLMPSGIEVPCRLFILTMPQVHHRLFVAMLRSVSPGLARDADFLQKLDVMCLAIVGLKGRDLSAIFPVPFAAKPPDLSSQLKILSVWSAFAQPTPTSGYKVDGIVPAMLRGLSDLGVVDGQTIFDDIETAAGDSYFRQSTGRAGVTETLGGGEHYYGQSALPAKNYDASLADTGKLYKEIVEATLAGMLKFDGMLKPRPWMGQDTSYQDHDALKLVDLTGNVSTTAADGVDYVVEFRDKAGPMGHIDRLGYAYPEDVNGTTRIKVQVTGFASASYPRLKATLHQQLLRGWRWLKVLEEPGDETTQTLLRMNEPLWEYICLKTIKPLYIPETFASGYTDEADWMDKEAYTGKLMDLKVLGLTPDRAHENAQALGGQGELGELGDGCYPWNRNDDALLDHRAAALMLRALNRAPGEKLAVFEKGVTDLVSSGFTRRERNFNHLVFPGPRGEPQDQGHYLSIKEDLVWLAGIVTEPGGEPLAGLKRPLGFLDGTQMARNLNTMVGGGANSIGSIEFLENGNVVPITEVIERLRGYRFFLCERREDLEPIKALLKAEIGLDSPEPSVIPEQDAANPPSRFEGLAELESLKNSIRDRTLNPHLARVKFNQKLRDGAEFDTVKDQWLSVYTYWCYRYALERELKKLEDDLPQVVLDADRPAPYILVIKVPDTVTGFASLEHPNDPPGASVPETVTKDILDAARYCDGFLAATAVPDGDARKAFAERLVNMFRDGEGIYRKLWEVALNKPDDEADELNLAIRDFLDAFKAAARLATKMDFGVNIRPPRQDPANPQVPPQVLPSPVASPSPNPQ